MLELRKWAKPLIALLVLPLAACSANEEEGEFAYGTPQQLMADHVQTTADVYWQAVRFESVLMPDGSVEDREFEPSTDEEWEEVTQAAVKLGELGLALQGPDYAKDRSPEWGVFANGLVETAARAEQAARDHNPEEVFIVSGHVYNVCKACHQAFPPDDLPDGMNEEDFVTSNASEE